jgi:hypothetical protein
MSASYEQAQAVKRAHEAELLRKANVVGVGVGLRHQGGERTDEIAIVVMVRQKMPHHELSPEDRIPRAIDGVPVDVQAVGDITAQE